MAATNPASDRSGRSPRLITPAGPAAAANARGREPRCRRGPHQMRALIASIANLRAQMTITCSTATLSLCACGNPTFETSSPTPYPCVLCAELVARPAERMRTDRRLGERSPWLFRSRMVMPSIDRVDAVRQLGSGVTGVVVAGSGAHPTARAANVSASGRILPGRTHATRGRLVNHERASEQAGGLCLVSGAVSCHGAARACALDCSRLRRWLGEQF
jgi:hypothetical protein